MASLRWSPCVVGWAGIVVAGRPARARGGVPSLAWSLVGKAWRGVVGRVWPAFADLLISTFRTLTGQWSGSIRANMATDFITALKAEIAGLEVELQADPRQQRLQQLRTLLAMYEQRHVHLQAQSLVAGRPRFGRPVSDGQCDGTAERRSHPRTRQHSSSVRQAARSIRADPTLWNTSFRKV